MKLRINTIPLHISPPFYYIKDLMVITNQPPQVGMLI